MQSVSEMRRKDLDRVALALLLHDVGMSKVPAFVVNKKGPLKQEERDKIILHPLLGVKIMQKMDISFEELIRACFEHHERLDSSGYPQHEPGSRISRIGRLTAVVDSFSAMIMDKPYGSRREPADAARELAQDNRYDAEFTRPLMAAFAAQTFGQLIDMDAHLVEAAQQYGRPASVFSDAPAPRAGGVFASAPRHEHVRDVSPSAFPGRLQAAATAVMPLPPRPGSGMAASRLLRRCAFRGVVAGKEGSR